MSVTRTIGGLALGTLILAGCEPQTDRSAIGQNYGDQRERQLRAVQLQGATSGVNPGTQNAPVTSASPGVDGIERSGVGGGSVSGGAPVAVNLGTTGITHAPGVGAPSR